MHNREDIQFGGLVLRSDKPFLILEAGVNHENDLGVAKKMVEEAALAGADAIKFQSYKAERLASVYSEAYWDTEKEPIQSQYELFKKHDAFGIAEYRELAQHSKKHGIVFLSTPFDSVFVERLEPLMPVFKVASADITNYPLLECIAAQGKPVILSTGASTVGEIADAVGFLQARCVEDIALLHCVLCYPTAPEDANLVAIEDLRRLFPSCTIGYSDHLPPAFGGLVLTLAWLNGARILETHFTLDKALPGNDHYHALDPDDIVEFRRQCEYATSLIGRVRRTPYPCEEDARKHARRSLVAGREIRAGDVIQRDDVEIKRPGGGIEPRFLKIIVGAIARRDIREDELLRWEMFLEDLPNAGPS